MRNLYQTQSFLKAATILQPYNKWEYCLFKYLMFRCRMDLRTSQCDPRLAGRLSLHHVFLAGYRSARRKRRLIEGNAKCRHLKKLTSTWTLRPRTPYHRPPPPPLHTVYVNTVYLFTQGREGGREESEPERRLEGQQFTKLGRKCHHE